ncbi:MAG TPA: hypothetical protein VI259_19515, partial [Gemmatimonadaceae bacterium]
MRRGLPLEHAATRPPHSNERPPNRVDGQQGLVGQQDHGQGELPERPRRIAGDRRVVRTPRLIARR